MCLVHNTRKLRAHLLEFLGEQTAVRQRETALSAQEWLTIRGVQAGTSMVVTSHMVFVPNSLVEFANLLPKQRHFSTQEFSTAENLINAMTVETPPSILVSSPKL